jgi:hypothetical protein
METADCEASNWTQVCVRFSLRFAVETRAAPKNKGISALMTPECPSDHILKYIQTKIRVHFNIRRGDSKVGIATGYGLDGRRVGVRVPVGSKIYLLQVVRTGSGAHPASYSMGTKGFFPEEQRPGREADHLPPSSAEVKKTRIYTSTSPYAFMA